MMSFTIGCVCFTACAKNVSSKASSQSPQVTPIEETATAEPQVPIESVVSPEYGAPLQPNTPEDSENTTAMQIKIGDISEKVLAVNVSCGAFKVRRSIQNKEVTISNIPLYPQQCKLKFSPGGAVYIVQKYEGNVLECNVMNGNEASCK